jgi:hypothetical protein
MECDGWELKLDSLYGSDTIECLSDWGGFILPIGTGVTLSLLDGTWFVGRDEAVGEIDCTGASDIG